MYQGQHFLAPCDPIAGAPARIPASSCSWRSPIDRRWCCSPPPNWTCSRHLATVRLTRGRAGRADRRAPREPLRLLLESCAAEGLLDARRRPLSQHADDRRRSWCAAGRPTRRLAEVRARPVSRVGQAGRAGADRRPAMRRRPSSATTRRRPAPSSWRCTSARRGIGAVLPHGVDFAGRKRLLDIGGGPGTYSMALCRQTPGLRRRCSICPASSR